ncbi:VanZ family protein [Corynebacterium mastitidis]|uniref:VanZ family protein n=1 Tax=Corynebacterium mastitidis TaxID=161890 RepID=UPI000375CBD4|nr:VanZ family protein [Corynebacterium mastitidis]
MPFSASSLRQKVYVALCALYLAVVVSATLLKRWLSIGGVWEAGAHHQRSIDLELFNGFLDSPVWWGPWLNVVGNVILFVPLGVLIALARVRGPLCSSLRGAAAGVLVSAAIESAQYVFAVGYSDIDDLLCNAVGSALGAWGASGLRQAQGPRAAR